MKKISAVLVAMMIFSVMSVMSFSPLAVSAAGENMLEQQGLDPSFETHTLENGIQTSDDKHSGTYCNDMVPLVPSGVFAQSWYNPWDPLKGAVIQPNYQYEVSAWVRMLDKTTNQNKVELQCAIASDKKDSMGNVIAASAAKAIEGPAGNWTQIKFIITSPSVLGKFDPYNVMKIAVWSFRECYVDDFSFVEVGPKPTPSPTPPRAATVSINKVTDATVLLFGKTSPVSTSFTLKYGAITKEVKSVGAGLWSVTLSKPLAVGTKITLTAATVKTIYVGASMAPTVSAVTSKSLLISGKTYKNAVVTIKIGTKTYTVKANSAGVFKQKLMKALKKGSKFTVKAKVAGQYTPIRTVTVK
ncbi:MAG: Ig-like domain-containing protein [Bacillota bacterium]